MNLRWCNYCGTTDHNDKDCSRTKPAIPFFRDPIVRKSPLTEQSQERDTAPLDAQAIRRKALTEAANVIELYDDATMNSDYMLSSTECAEIIRALIDKEPT